MAGRSITNEDVPQGAADKEQDMKQEKETHATAAAGDQAHQNRLDLHAMDRAYDRARRFRKQQMKHELASRLAAKGLS